MKHLTLENIYATIVLAAVLCAETIVEYLANLILTSGV